jgi:hypothetical protein
MDNLRKSIENFIGKDGLIAEIYMVIKDEEKYYLREMDIKEGNQRDITNNFFDFFKDEIISNDTLQLLLLSNHDERKNVLYEYDYDIYPDDFEMIDLVNKETEVTKFNFSSDDIKSLRCFLIRMKYDGEELIIYKQHYPTSYIAKENKHNIQVFNRGNRFEIFESNMIRFNNKVDFFRFNNKNYIINMKVLERFFQFHEVIKMHAAESIEKIRKVDFVENIDELANMLENTTFARKLVRVGKHSPVLGKIPKTEIVSFIKAYPKLSSHIKLNSEGDKVILDTNKSKEALIKLLNDDYLTSQLTNHYYESLAKDEVQ